MQPFVEIRGPIFRPDSNNAMIHRMKTRTTIFSLL